MSDIAVRVENVSKRYRIGMKNEMHDSFVGAMVDFVKRPLTNLKRLRKLSSFDQHSDDCDDIIWALRNVSFEVKRGEVVGIIGSNGSGKSTLLKILAGITHPTKGRAIVNGRVGSLLEVGTGFHPELTGRENIYLSGTILGMRKAEIDKKFEEIITFSGVEQFLDTPIKRYSSGMRVRLAFAVAAHLEPEILLIDEVLAVGDAAFQKKCLGKMGDVAKEGRTVLFVSHNMAAVQQLCSSAMLLQKGKVVYNGAVGQSIDLYLEVGAERSGSILTHVAYNNAAIKLKSTTVNSSQSDVLQLSPGCKQLNVVISGWIDRPMQLLIEARIYDLREQCLAFFTPRQNRQHFDLLPVGAFRLIEAIGLPQINQGEYFLSLYVAESDQHTKNPVHIHKAVRIRAEGTPTVTGWVFKYARGNGWMLLPIVQGSKISNRVLPNSENYTQRSHVNKI
jgi:lipopolysaccharide transport system ATP-binding protein